MNGFSREYVTILALAVAVMASAIASVYAKHESRQLFTELQSLSTERDEMEVEWGKLQIEQSTWSTYGRVEQLAREQMDMRVPPPEEVSLLTK
ncbi:MAG: cell division protein FtsL [Gammaproteobacteria bacterium]|nr:cell division protein FtsL [Gammaproteobacteria bacterium]MBT8444627.1 cell division protein FtsL [Gammaproteobacteria bacterium]NND35697.1 cell division protein FtsL [Gammaproteobacteria bacterium]